MEHYGNISCKAKWDNDNLNTLEGQVTPLMIASIKRNHETAKYLLRKGAKVAEKDRRGLTALAYSLYSTRTEIFGDLYFRLSHNSIFVDAIESRMKKIFFRMLSSQYIPFDLNFLWLQEDFALEKLINIRKRSGYCLTSNATEIMELNRELSDQLVRRIPASKHLSFYQIGDCVYNDCDISLNFDNVIDSRCKYCEQQIR